MMIKIGLNYDLFNIDGRLVARLFKKIGFNSDTL